MSDFDYGNARLHAMKARLLSRHTLESLAETTSIQGFIAKLAQSNYRKSIEIALTRASGIDCVNHALHLDLINTLGDVRSFFHERTIAWIDIVLRAYDIFNLKTILRALNKNLPPADFQGLLLPIGDLKLDTLTELSRAPGPREMIDLLASMNSPFSQPLIKLRSERPGVQVPDMEFALEQWYFRGAKASMTAASQRNTTLLAAVKLDADITNILTVLRFTHTSHVERKLYGDQHPNKMQPSSSNRLSTGEENQIFVGPGRIPFALLNRAASQDTPKAAIDILERTSYESALHLGLQAYQQSFQLSSFEKQLKRMRLDWSRRLIQKDPLGIGVLLGYVALKTNEIGNLRWISTGIQMGLKPKAIISELELIS